jgi:Mrp family chromosome partitioning ATPase
MARHTNLLPESNDSLMSDASLDLALREQSAHVTGAPPKRNALKMVHRLLRGKYHWLIILGLAFGAAGAAAGWRKGVKSYASTGAIKIKYQLDNFMFQNADSTLQNADGFFQEQISNMTSMKVVSRAVQQPDWLALKPNIKLSGNDLNATMLAAQDLLRRVKVSQKNDQVQVEVRDPDPAIAEAGAKSILSAYKALFLDVNEEDARIEVLQQEVKKLDIDIQAVQLQIREIAEKRGSEDLDAVYNSRRERLDQMETRVADLESALSMAKLQQESGATQPGTAATQPVELDLDLEKVAVNDPILGPLLLKRSEAEFALQKAQRGTNRQAVLDAEAYKRSIQEQMDNRLSSIILARAAGIPVPGIPPVKSENDLKEIEFRLTIAKPIFEQAVKDLEALGIDNSNLKQLHRQETDLRNSKKGFTDRIQQLRLENPNKRRIELVTLGEQPIFADKDTRPKYAAAGGMAGLMGAAGLVMLIGYLSGKIKTRRDLQFDLEDKPLIGLIPKLKKGEDSSKLSATAAEFVHRSRTMLEIWARGSEKMVIGVTSPSHGSGNTSVAMSLGVSFATAGIRTLLVDVDFVTNGLTPRLQTTVRRELGRVLVRQGMISEDKLEHARKVVFEESGGKVNGGLAKPNGANGHNGHNGHNGYGGHNGHNEPNGTFTTNAVNPKQGVNQDRILGEACVKLGYITEDQLERALRVQAREPVGLLDALSGEPIENCIGKTGIRNLSILPRGNVTPAHAAKLSTHSMRHVLAIARQQYDTVIVDTSAILTSLEAAIVASSVDGMVMTVARGEKRSRLVEAMNRLGAMGCPMAGAIFNHVSPKDMPPELNIGRVSTMNDNTVDEEMIQANAELVGRLDLIGPLASTMVSRVPVLDQKVAEDDQ